MTYTSARAAVTRAPKSAFVIEDVEIASPRDHEVLVRMVATGMCHTDIVVRDGFPIPMPVVLGHEGAGVVERVGSSVTNLRVGDHVVLSFASCQNCPSCRRNHPSYCQRFLAYNFSGGRPEDASSPIRQKGRPIHGNFFGQSSFATHAIAHEINAVRVSKDLPLDILGPLGCGVQTGAGAVINSLKLQEGDSFAIFGGGAVGLSALLAARAVQAGPVYVVEPNASRRELALSLGAAHALDPTAGGDVVARIKELNRGGVTHALDTTGNATVVNAATEVVGSNGVLALLGMCPPDTLLSVNLSSLMLRGAGIKYLIEGDSDPKTFIPHLAKLFQERKFPFDRLIWLFAFNEINQAAYASEAGHAIKPVLVF